MRQSCGLLPADQIVDPWGEVVARCEDPGAEGIAVADIDLSLVRAVRERMPLAAHRRYDVYGAWTPP